MLLLIYCIGALWSWCLCGLEWLQWTPWPTVKRCAWRFWRTKMARSVWCTAHCHTCFALRFVILCWPWLWKLWEQFHGSYWCPESLPLSKLPVRAEHPAPDAGETDRTQRVPTGYVSQKVSPALLGGGSWPQLFGILTESWAFCWWEFFRLRIHCTAKFMVLTLVFEQSGFIPDL